MISTSKDAPQVVTHVCEVKILLSDGEISLKGSNLLAQDEQLLDEEELPIHGRGSLLHCLGSFLQCSNTQLLMLCWGGCACPWMLDPLREGTLALPGWGPMLAGGYHSH